MAKLPPLTYIQDSETEGAARRLRRAHSSVRAGRKISVRRRQPLPGPRGVAGDVHRAADKLGLSTAVIVSPGGYGRDYSLLADVLTKYPKRFRGIALVRDDIPDSELARLTKLGVRGMRMTSVKRGQHVPNYAPGIAARVNEHGWQERSRPQHPQHGQRCKRCNPPPYLVAQCLPGCDY